ncbi:MAG: hypothetical protein EXS30_11630 [Pedosphaera sp.]|nr:hypothetical protein [Pedosphaera sp.]
MKTSIVSLVLLANLATARASEPLPDFTLDDVNPRSVRQTSTVSPRDYLLQVSGYYFGSAG